jgi:hypothetical protein
MPAKGMLSHTYDPWHVVIAPTKPPLISSLGYMSSNRLHYEYASQFITKLPSLSSISVCHVASDNSQ